MSKYLTCPVVLLCLACSPGQRDVGSERLARESIAIRQLHDADMKAVVAGDTSTLMSLWTDDIVSLPPTGSIRRGRLANADGLRQAMRESEGVTPVDYKLSFDELQILGDVAVEWGTYSSKVKLKSGDSSATAGGKLMRVLQRQPSGRWLVWRTIYTLE